MGIVSTDSTNVTSRYTLPSFLGTLESNLYMHIATKLALQKFKNGLSEHSQVQVGIVASLIVYAHYVALGTRNLCTGHSPTPCGIEVGRIRQR